MRRKILIPLITISTFVLNARSQMLLFQLLDLIMHYRVYWQADQES